MSENASLEVRLSAVEKALQALEKRLNQHAPKCQPWQTVVGSIKDDEIFQQILKYGREARKQIDEDESY
jgi:hypothetical protein